MNGNGTTRCGLIALVGPPNVGKSTLLNRLVGGKVSIVSPKAQTTRARLRAIAMAGDAQLVFIDTPGIFFEPRRRLERAMVEAAWAGIADADTVVVMQDARRLDPAVLRRIAAALGERGRRFVLLLNKVDLVARPSLLTRIEELRAIVENDDIFLISALDGDGVDDLLTRLVELVPPGPWLYPPDQLADLSERLLAAEITREQIFLQLHDELPYAITVETENWQERRDGSAAVEQVIYVQRDTQKSIVLGRQGQRIKQIGSAARLELERLLERRVHLKLFVKVRPKWIDDPERYREIGLDYPR